MNVDERSATRNRGSQRILGQDESSWQAPAVRGDHHRSMCACKCVCVSVSVLMHAAQVFRLTSFTCRKSAAESRSSRSLRLSHATRRGQVEGNRHRVCATQFPIRFECVLPVNTSCIPKFSIRIESLLSVNASCINTQSLLLVFCFSSRKKNQKICVMVVDLYERCHGLSEPL